ncbi:MAG TPA: efflux RND transporter periplasmic adaptor subunit [Candidatus Polarisedimenticolia bacterium]|nr:efflux RND transporter periplasmic adaptor subunit [Candidatus Polarisedimenticolia bacterium]
MTIHAKRTLGSLIAVSLLGVLVFAGIGCSRKGEKTGSGAPEAPKRAETLYQCPMHPAMQSDKPGDCPICGMRMVPIEKGEVKSRPKKIIYRSTMNPNEVSDKPGKDSMGMEMERVELDETPRESPTVAGRAAINIPFRKQQLIGVRTTAVKRAPFVRTIKTVGRVASDETRLHHVHSKIEGWVEKLSVNATGERVRKGQPLLSLYSPELLAAQEEYLLARKSRKDLGDGAPQEAAKRVDDLVESSRRRLLLVDFTSDQIEQLEKSGQSSRTVTLFAPVSGYVLQRNVTQGERIDSSATLLDIADLSRVWVLASVFEYEVPFVEVGQSALMTLDYLPGKSFQGKVTLLYPVLDSASRTVQVRLEFANPGLELKPDMYAQVELRSDLGERLVVPESAVLSSGTRNIVFVAQGEGYFEPREVRLGLRLPDAVEVMEGLKEGESVVTSGNFLIDSESKLKAALEATAAPPPSPSGTATQPAKEK